MRVNFFPPSQGPRVLCSLSLSVSVSSSSFSCPCRSMQSQFLVSLTDTSPLQLHPIIYCFSCLCRPYSVLLSITLSPSAFSLPSLTLFLFLFLFRPLFSSYFISHLKAALLAPLSLFNCLPFVILSRGPRSSLSLSLFAFSLLHVNKDAHFTLARRFYIYFASINLPSKLSVDFINLSCNRLIE